MISTILTVVISIILGAYAGRRYERVIIARRMRIAAQTIERNALLPADTRDFCHGIVLTLDKVIRENTQ